MCRDRSKLRSWISFILLHCVSGLPSRYSDMTVATYPSGTITVRYGDPIEIFCVAESYTSDDIEFSLLGRHVESERINETSRRLYIESPEKQLSVYYCRNKKTSKVCMNRVVVDSPPQNVTDFNCISSNLDKLNCSWTNTALYTRVSYTLVYVYGGHQIDVRCKANQQRILGSKINYCVWDITSSPRYRQQEPTLHLDLRACNTLGCINQSFTIDHYSIVKPDPPFNLEIFKNGTHSVGLTWSIPYNMYDLLPCGVEHIIEYRIAKIDNTTYFHRVDALTLPLKKHTYKFQLSNLPYARMQYEVRVYIKSKNAVNREYWSDYSRIVFYTASDRPSRPPEMTVGAFEQATFTEHRILSVYWKQIEEYEEAGPNFTYKVIITQGNKTFPAIYPDKNKSLSFVTEVVSFEALDVTIWSVNENGSSLNNSHMYIPAHEDTQILHISSLTKLSHENGTYELYWFGNKNVDNYTLFWCQYNASNICLGRIQFAVLDPTKNNYIIDLPTEYRYQFAISANKGSKSSGMVWAKCDISKYGFIMYDLPGQLRYDDPSESSVRLRWQMGCALHGNTFVGYKISYCPLIHTISNCDPAGERMYILISDSTQMDVLIDNLLPFRTYQFTLSINTIYGQKNIENATVLITTTEDTPSSPINVGVSDVRSDSLVFSWDPPLHKNGNIDKYVIYNYEKEFYVDEVSGTDVSRRQVTLTGLTGFTNYYLTVRACNIALRSCSKPGPGIFVKT